MIGFLKEILKESSDNNRTDDESVYVYSHEEWGDYVYCYDCDEHVGEGCTCENKEKYNDRENQEWTQW